MQPQDIHLSDWMRILVGDVPATFYIELIIRAFIVYLIIMVSMRSMGKRMSSQLSRNDLAALVSIAAAVGMPMMAPDRGVLPAVVIAFVLVSVERLIASISCKNEKFENYAQGRVSSLISDGVIDMKELLKTRLSHERVLAQLRSSGTLHLGEVSRLYMEAGGNFTLIRNPEPAPGLAVLPPWDHGMRARFREHPEQQVCVQCGLPKNNLNNADQKCPNCGSKKWVTAVVEETNDQH